MMHVLDVVLGLTVTWLAGFFAGREVQRIKAGREAAHPQGDHK